MAFKSRFWRETAFQASMVVCVMFVVLTAIAMLFYPGGTTTDPEAPRYLFFQNFFSDLGLTKSKSGESNVVSAVLFVLAMCLAGGILALQFTAFAQFFNHSSRGRLLSRLGAAAGVISGISLVGIAATPADLHGWAHGVFVGCAIGMFLLAILLYTTAILSQSLYPKQQAIAFAALALLLVAYVVLISTGPSAETSSGLKIQVAGQKVIVYAVIISIFIQAWAALRFARSRPDAIGD